MKIQHHHIRRIIWFLFGIYCSSAILAQDEQTEARSEFTISIGGGMSSLFTNDPLALQKQAGLGGNLGLSYTYFVSPRIGLGTGIEIASCQSKYMANQITGSATGNDPLNPGYIYTLNYTYQNFEEQLNNVQCQIPVYLQYQGATWPRFYMRAGVLIGYHISSESHTYANKLSVTSNFSYEGQTYHEIGDGIESLRNVNQKRDLSLKSPDCKLSIEIGSKWKVNKINGLYGGLYVDYGLNNLLEEPIWIPRIVAVDGSQYVTNDLVFNTASIQKLRSISVGIKVRYAFGIGSMTVIKRAPANNTGVLKAHPDASTYQRANQSFQSQPSEIQESARTITAETSTTNAVPVTESTTITGTEQKDATYYVVTPVYKDNAQPVEEYSYETTDDYRYPVFDQGTVSEAELQHVARSIREQAMAVLSEPIDNYSDIAESALTPEMKKRLDRKIAILKNEPSIVLLVSGHTCNVKSDAINHEIGIQRANEVKYYLVLHGIDPTRITTSSVGAQEPVTSDNSENGRRKNRRVTFTAIYSTSIQYPNHR